MGNDSEDGNKLLQVQDGCQTFKIYELVTHSYNRLYPQPTIYTSTASVPLATPIPSGSDQPFNSTDTNNHTDANKDANDHNNNNNNNNIADDNNSSSQPYTHRNEKRGHQSNPALPLYPWYDVVAVEHLTSIGPLCPTPAPKAEIDSPGSPKTNHVTTATDVHQGSNSNQDQNQTHSTHPHVNVHVAIIAGAIATCAIVIILSSIATLIICFRRRRRLKSDQDGLEVLRDHLDETSTTLSSIASDQGKERLENFNHHQQSSPTWIITSPPISKLNQSIHQPFNQNNEATIETLSINNDHHQNNLNGNWTMNLIQRRNQLTKSNDNLRCQSPSISISEESNAPSYFIGDESKFNKLRVPSSSNLRHCHSNSALSCAATIASESVISSQQVIEHHSSTDQNQLTPNITSLIEHKTFLWEMMSRNQAFGVDQSDVKSLESDLGAGESSESVYWKSRSSS